MVEDQRNSLLFSKKEGQQRTARIYCIYCENCHNNNLNMLYLEYKYLVIRKNARRYLRSDY